MAGTEEPRDARTLPDLDAPGFVGREPELAALGAALAGGGALVLVAGEAGIGKSRLLAEALAGEGDGRRVLRADCPPFREPFPLGPVVDAVRRATDDVAGLRLSGLAGALRPILPEWAEALPPSPEPLDDVRASRYRLFRALTELLDRLDAGALVVEDVHWADEATLEFLLFLASRDPRPLSVVVSYRPEDLAADSLVLRLSSRPRGHSAQLRLELGPLDVDQTAALVSSMLGGEHVSEPFAELLREHTDGLPLAVEESVRLMRDRADLVRRNGEWVRRRLDEIEVPPTVRDAVLERVSRLSSRARDVLGAAAVLSEPSSAALVAATAGMSGDAATSGLVEALGCGLLVEDERGLVSFRHVLAGRTVYETVPPPDRRASHARAGAALERAVPQPVASLARHFRAAGDAVAWCRYGERAADLARDSGDEVTATDLLCELVTAGDPTPTMLARFVEKVSMATLARPEVYRQVADALRSTVSAGGHPPEVEGELCFQLGRTLTTLEEYTERADALERAVPLLTDRPVQAVRAMLLLGRPDGTMEPVAHHRAWLERAAESAVRLTPEERLGVHVERVTSLLLLGEEDGWAEAATLPGEIESPAARQHVVRAHLNVGDAAIRWGRYAEARRRLSRAAELAERHELVRSGWLARVNLAHLDWFTGDWQGLAERAGDRGEDGDLPLLREAVLVGGLLRAAGGDHAGAATCLEGVLATTRRAGIVDGSMEPAAALALLRLASGRVGDALAVTQTAVEQLAVKGLWVLGTEIVPARVQALLASGDDEAAGRLVEVFGVGLGRRDAPAASTALALGRALVVEASGDTAGAAEAFAHVADAWRALPRPYDALLAQERQGRCLLVGGRRDEALDLLRAVCADLGELGAVTASARVAHTLRDHGVDVKRPWRGGRRGYGDELSPRELDVARLVVGGRTNKEIGGVLYLSPKTVARHLNGAMRKLGVSTRTALAVAVLAAGLVPDRERDASARPE